MTAPGGGHVTVLGRAPFDVHDEPVCDECGLSRFPAVTCEVPSCRARVCLASADGALACHRVHALAHLMDPVPLVPWPWVRCEVALPTDAF